MKCEYTCINKRASSSIHLFAFTMSDRVVFQERGTAFDRRLFTFAVVNVEHIDIGEFLADAYHHLQAEITKLIEVHTLVKVNTVFKATFSKFVDTDEGEQVVKQPIYINSKNYVIDFETDLHEYYQDVVVAYTLAKVDDIVMRGSGFSLTEINELLVQVNEFRPIAGSTYIPLPPELAKKKAIVNVQNTDNHCFKYAVISALHPVKRNAQRVSNYLPFSNALIFDGIDFPVRVKDVKKFEKLNSNISINLYMYDEKKKNVSTLRMTRAIKQHHIHLLLLVRGDISHYCWIKSMSRLLSSQISCSAHSGVSKYLRDMN